MLFMNINTTLCFVLGLILTLNSCTSGDQQPTLEKGLVINQSTTFTTDTILLSSDSLSQPVLTIRGNDLTVDFSNLLLRGSEVDSLPHRFTGVAIRIQDSKNVTLRNLRARGFKVAIMAENSPGLTIEDCDLSYNFRQKLGSTREEEDLDDWMYYHQNEADEWLRYGAAIYLKNCDEATVHNVYVTGGQNGLMMTGCDHGLFYNNTMHFNSGIGIGLYRSSNNQVLHNRLDWNVRGYSHGIYSRGQDSAGILCYAQSDHNLFAYNSATHSGDGFFLWAGQETMETGEGGCNDNLIYGNDFSYAPANGIESTFSRNTVVNNKLHGCRYGIWGGYSFESTFTANWIAACDYGIAIEHGQDNTISFNLISDTEEGIKLWQRNEQPADWGYVSQRDTRSRNYTIRHNVFRDVQTPLVIAGSEQVAVDHANQFLGYQQLLRADQPNKKLLLQENVYDGPANPVWSNQNEYVDPRPMTVEPGITWAALVRESKLDSLAPEYRADGMETFLPPQHLKGRQYILVDKWGPYDFRRPIVWLRETSADTYTFILLGPTGNWKLTDGSGFASFSAKTGTFPATFTAQIADGDDPLQLNFEFIGEAVTTQFGEQFPKGTPVSFAWAQHSSPTLSQPSDD